ncbi:DoxX family protein [Paenibacillus piri]|uniref:DoxX family protein n=2 Tax=Paenibacillus piri TaxID=2547395 RepID=A0A4R5KP43_9BACL|nr:DoxX family protein [Paenibacillus piri]
MNKQKIIYWIFTSLLILLMGGGVVPNLLSSPEWVAIFEHLVYPPYLLPFLGAAKLLGILAILIPRYPRLKEWAYAGFVFDLSGALYSVLAIGDASGGIIVFFIGYALIAGSYIYSLKLQKAKSTIAAPNPHPRDGGMGRVATYRQQS